MEKMCDSTRKQNPSCPTIDETLEFIKKAHNGQRDKGGEAYWVHPYHVSRLVQGGILEKLTALLHDILEDTSYTYDDLKRMGYPEDVLIALVVLTKLKGEKYETYIDRVARNEIAMKVKMADLLHNMDSERLPIEDRNTEKVKQRMEKYKRAYFKLEGIYSKLKSAHKKIHMVVGLQVDNNKKVRGVAVTDGYEVYNLSPDGALGLNTTNFVQFPFKCEKDEQGYYFDLKELHGIDGSATRYAKTGSLTIIGKNEEGSMYIICRNNILSIVRKENMTEYVKKGGEFTNAKVINFEKGTFSGIKAIQVVPIIEPITYEELERLKKEISTRKLSRNKVEEIPLAGYPEGYVPVAHGQKEVARTILGVAQNDIIHNYINDNDVKILEEIIKRKAVPKTYITALNTMGKKLKKIDKNDIIKRSDLPKDLLSSESFYSMLTSNNPAKLVSNINMFKTMDKDELEVYRNTIGYADKITGVVRKVADNMNLKLYGEKFRVKSVTSFMGKLHDRDSDLTKEEELACISDVIRFTFIVDDIDNYGAKVNSVLEMFKAIGYDIKKVKNYWVDKKNTYKGVNCQLVSDDNIPFEVQFHIPEYLRIKDEIHTWYEFRRDKKNNIAKGSKRYAYCLHQEQELVNTITFPRDVDLVKSYAA